MGAVHPILGGQENAWELTDTSDAEGIWAWMADTGTGEPSVILQGPDGEVHIPRNRLAVLARGLLAAHVDAGRPDHWPPR